MMAGLDSPDNSRCQETTVPVGTRLFSQLATSSHGRDETTKGLCGGLGNIYCPGGKCFLETRQLQRYKGPVAALPLGSLYLLLDSPPKNFEKYM